MTDKKDIVAAEAERDAARARLNSTIALVKTRIAPSTIAKRTTDDIKRKAKATGTNAVDGVRDHPAAAAGGVAALFAVGAVCLTRRRRAKRAAEHVVTTDSDLAAVSSGFGRVPEMTQTLKERD